MAVIENEIQYNWVQKRVAKLKERVNENTPANSPYRIELELLSNSLKEYYEEHPSILKQEMETVTKIIAQECINFDEEIPELKIKKGVYAELPELLKLVKAGAIEKEMGVSSGWLSMRLNHSPNGKYSIRRFAPSDMEKLNRGIWRLAKNFSTITIPYFEDRAECVKRLKEASKPMFITELCLQKLGLEALQCSMRMLTGASAKYRPRFTKSELEQLTLGIHEIAAQMLSVEYYLDEE